MLYGIAMGQITKVIIDRVTITTYAYDNCNHVEHNTALR